MSQKNDSICQNYFMIHLFAKPFPFTTQKTRSHTFETNDFCGIL